MVVLLILTHAHWLSCIFGENKIKHRVAISVVAMGASTSPSTQTLAIGIKNKEVEVALKI